MTRSAASRAAAHAWGLAVLAGLLSVAIVACGSGSTDQSFEAVPTASPATAESTTVPTRPADVGPVVYADPVYQPDGNRLVDGSGLGTGFIQQVTTKDVNLADAPTWVTGASTPEGDVWAVALGRWDGCRLPRTHRWRAGRDRDSWRPLGP